MFRSYSDHLQGARMFLTQSGTYLQTESTYTHQMVGMLHN